MYFFSFIYWVCLVKSNTLHQERKRFQYTITKPIQKATLQNKSYTEPKSCSNIESNLQLFNILIYLFVNDSTILINCCQFMYSLFIIMSMHVCVFVFNLYRASVYLSFALPESSLINHNFIHFFSRQNMGETAVMRDKLQEVDWQSSKINNYIYLKYLYLYVINL